jgi:hypothetical protein
MRIYKFSSLALAIFVFCTSFANSACLDLSDGCGNDIASEVVSPNRKMKAVIFQRDCGATTGFSTQISVLPNNKTLPNESGNVFYADDNDGKAKLNKDFALENLEVKWLNDTDLLIRYDKQAKASEFEKLPSGIKVIYEKLP